MKKIIIGAFAGMMLLSALAFKMAYDLKNSSAEVEQMEGYYIFVDSKPVKEYEYLGTVKGASIGGFGDTQYSGIRDNMIKRAKKDYPKADGLIFSFSSSGRDKVDAIKFK
jgi:hypothetical protein